MVKRYISISIILLSCILVSSFSPIFKPVFSIKTVVIDPGHGGKDPGCHGSKYKEKDVALAVALKLGKYIEENLKDVKVIYTRKTDVFVELQARAEIANRAKADLFICIHCNSACVRDKKLKRDICKEEIRGSETYVMGIKNEQGKLDVAKRENSAILLEDNYVQKYNGFDPNSDESYIIMSMFTDTYLDQSLNFASKLQGQYKGKAARVDKGVKRASLWVLWRTYMPSVLTEIGYLTNPEEEQFLGSAKGQDYIASGIFKAFRAYKDEIEGAVKKYDDFFEKQEIYKMTKEDSIEVENNKKLNTPIPIKKDTIELKPVKPIEEEKKPIADDKKMVDTIVKAEIKPAPKVTDKIIIEPKVIEPIVTPVSYKVQIISSDKKIALDADKLKGIEKPGEYLDKGIYKYTAGEFANSEDALKLQALLRKNGFPDAFVIALKDGKRVPLK
ncbi:MAG: N-acetylmuramoyl-L-alanine amidase [Bacteroidetes bacterium]|nr:N-acetylmuramoyl-L-alanine amidase [Bacteroidota bacterium]